MILAEAQAILEQVLAPITLEQLLEHVGAGWLEAKGAHDHPRARIFGPDPELTVLSAFATHAAILDCHSPAPLGPKPEAKAMPDAKAFRALIGSFHANGYTVRVPHVVPLSPELQLFARALEHILHQPVTASLFWSAAGAKAQIHYDDEDNIVIQLSGRKRWFISTDPPGLQNEWKDPAEAPPELTRYRSPDVEPGDLLYLPRGTTHTVVSETESLHLAVLFKPITLRDAIIAAVDQLSDLDRTFRETALGRAGDIETAALGDLNMKVAAGLSRLAVQVRDPAFLHRAMERRSSRVIGKLPPLPKGEGGGITPETIVRQNPLAIAHLTPSPRAIDLSQPGGHSFLHPGAEPALRFICTTPRFPVRDVPGGLAPEVQVALVQSLIGSGFLERDS